jgi:DNA polymerase III delta subunit
VVRVYSGDPFLAGRAFREALSAARAGGAEVVRLGEGLDANALRDALSQGSLFGPSVVALDLDEAFGASGRDATGPRNAVLDALAGAPGGDVHVLDPTATPARLTRWRSFAEVHHQPTPRFGALARWVRDELARAGVATTGDVAGTLVDLFGEDVAGIASEIAKLRALDERFTPERVRLLVHRPAARSAFDLVDALAAGDAALALRLAHALLLAGEPPLRVMGALGWQLDLIAGCVALRAAGAVDEGEAARSLKAPPFAVRKALAVASRLDERSLGPILTTFVRADERMKGGGDPEWGLEACVLELAEALAPSVYGERGQGRPDGGRW